MLNVNKLLFTVYIVFLLVSVNLQAQVNFDLPYKESVSFPDCIKPGLCGLKSFQFLFQDYKINYSADDISYGTRMFAEYSTQEISQIEAFGIVQFVKGCQFQSRIQPAGVEYIYNILRDFFNKRIPYIHKDWQIDSVDIDLMYNNTPPEFKEEWKTRHGLYRWNRQIGSYEPSTEVLFYAEKPTTPRLYIVDRPGTAFVVNGLAKNISLQFKTCIFPTREIAEVGSPEDLKIEDAIHCFAWESSFLYDHSRNVFTKSSQLHSACQ